GTDTATITLNVASVDDVPVVTVADAAGDEDTTIALDIGAVMDAATTETVASVEISGIPDGEVLSSGMDSNGDPITITVSEAGVATVDPGQLADLAITPPADSSADFTLGVAATSTDGGTSTASIPVAVTAVGDAAEVSVSDTSGAEDTAIALDISAAVADSTETVDFVTVAGVPEGASLSAGTSNINGTWTLEASELVGLTITPADDSNADFTLSVTATSTDGTTGAAADIDVTVSAVGDAAEVSVSDTSGLEDTAIALDISAAVPGSTETVDFVTVSGVPAGASLSAGTSNIDGTWTLEAGELTGLTITPPADDNADFTLSVTATSTDGTAGAPADIDVSVAAVGDAAEVSVSAASGDEDTAIALDISAAVPGSTETVDFVTVSGVPSGASLSAGTSNPDGTWTLEAGDLTGLTVTPAADSNVDFTLSVTATSTDGTTGAPAAIDVSVAAVADAPEMTVADAAGLEDTAITLNISAEVPGNEDLASIVIGNVPVDATLSVGTDSGLSLNGNVLTGSGEGGRFTVDDLLALEGGALSITPAPDDNTDFDLSVTATSTDGGISAAVLPIAVEAVAEDTDVTFTVSDGEATMTLADPDDYGEAETVDVDGGAVEYTYDDADSATVSVTDDWGSVASIDATSDEAADVVLQDFVEANVTLGGDGDSTVDIENAASGDVATGSGDDSIEITGQAGESGAFDVDAGAGDDTITLDGDYDASTVAGGAGEDTITTGGGEDVITGGADDDYMDGGAGADVAVFSGSFADYAISTDAATGEITVAGPDGTDTLVNIELLRFDDGDVPVEGIGGEPTVSITAAAGDEDQPIELLIDVSAASPFDPVGSITIGGVPQGATLSVGTDTGLSLDGNVLSGSGEGGQFTADDLQALADGAVEITPAENSDVDFSLSVSASSTSGATTQSVDMPVTVDAVADVPVITVELGDPTVTGGDGGATPIHFWNFEDHDGGPLEDKIGSADGQEMGSVEFDDDGRFGDGAELASGDGDGDGYDGGHGRGHDHHGGGHGRGHDDDDDDAIAIPHTEDMELDSGTVTVWFQSPNVDKKQGIMSKDSEHKNDGDFTMRVDDGKVEVRFESDDHSFKVEGGDLSDNSWHQATFSWGEDGMKLYVDGELVDTNDYAGGMADNLNPLVLGASAHKTDEGEADEDDLKNFFEGQMDDVAVFDRALTADEIGGLYSDGVQAMMEGDDPGTIEYPLEIATNLTDADGSESLGDVTIGGIPEGAELSAGTDNGNGTWTVSQGDLADLKLTVSDSVPADFQISVTVASTEAVGGDSAVASATIIVPVDVPDAENEAPVLEGDGETTVDAGDEVTITADDMHLADDTSDADELLYTLTDDVDFGSLYLDDGSGNRTDLDVGDTFSQEDIDLGLLSYEQDESLADFWNPETPEWGDGGAPVD
ncbi:MAG: hypothetical protein ISR44_11520, partial [Rhodospirillales bacterium]|nr:hypothetical protein [Rhodospirillales bacterium]